MTDVSPWQVERLDLDAYLVRVGVPAAPPSWEALDALHEAHVRAFTFDNIDVLLDQHPGVSLEPCRRSSSAGAGAGTASSTGRSSRRCWSGSGTTSSVVSAGSAIPPSPRGRTAWSS